MLSNSTLALLSLAVLAIAGILLTMAYRRHVGRVIRHERKNPSEKEDLDTTLGDFHDMREALRPLAKVQFASRRDPQGAP